MCKGGKRERDIYYLKSCTVLYYGHANNNLNLRERDKDLSIVTWDNNKKAVLLNFY